MMDRKTLLISALICLFISGCELNPPPECLPGGERCEMNSTFGGGVYYICRDTYEWVALQSCTLCEGKTCADPFPGPECENEGEMSCIDLESRDIQFECMDHKLIPSICKENYECIGDHCVEIMKTCDEGFQMCNWVDDLHVAIVSVCSNNQILTMYCGKGLKCDGDVCEEPVECSNMGEVRDIDTNTCVCDVVNHWTGEPDNCECEYGYLNINDNCEAEVDCLISKGEVRDDETNTCVCDTQNHWIGEPENCECDNGYLNINSVCEEAVDCTENAGEIRDDTTNTCICNELEHWTGEAGSCDCESGYLNVYGVCDEAVECTEDGEIRNDASNICVCDVFNHWMGEPGGCECETGYLKVQGICEEAVECPNVEEVRDNSINQCVCDTLNHWTGSVGSCECDTNYLRISDTCELAVDCPNVEEIRDDTTNTCVCDTANYWTGEAGSCTCTAGYVRVGDICGKKINCNSRVEVYNEATNTCSCNSSVHWVGEAGSCVCDDGWFTNTSYTKYCCSNADTSSFEYVSCLDIVDPQRGDICIFGHYKQIKDDDTMYPIRWRVVKTDSTNGLMLHSLYGLDHKPYNQTSRDITWEQCTLRSWLNGFGPEANLDGVDFTEDNFIKTAFNETEQAYLNTVTNSNPNYGTAPGGNSTEDKVYLANKTEAFYGLGYGTTYAAGGSGDPEHCIGEPGNVYGSVAWWYRGPGKDLPDYAAGWSGNGVQNHGPVTSDWVVFPTLWIKKVDCTNPGEVRDDSTNTCVCDTANHWVGEAGSCECDEGYLNIDNTCQVPVTCNGTTEVRDDSINQCVCNNSKHWVGEAGSCICDEGFFKNPRNSTICCTSNGTEFTEPYCVDLEDPQVGDICLFGRYRQYITTDEKQPIRWKIVDKDSNKGFLLGSIYILENRKINETEVDITWETCTLRSWLNGFGADVNTNGIDYSENSFMSIAFTEEEQAYIQTVTNTNPANGEAPASNDTQDKVFLLNKNDSRKYLGTWAYGTAYYYNTGAYADLTSCIGESSSNPMYPVAQWTRTPYTTTTFWDWSCRGAGDWSPVNEAGIGVRPALWFKK